MNALQKGLLLGALQVAIVASLGDFKTRTFLDASPHHLTRVAAFQNRLSGFGPRCRIVDPLAASIEARQ